VWGGADAGQELDFGIENFKVESLACWEVGERGVEGFPRYLGEVGQISAGRGSCGRLLGRASPRGGTVRA
jgi:hypothetical protein